MKILIDADALPNVIKDILLRAVERVRIPLILVANKSVSIGKSPLITRVLVPAGPDVADIRIVELVEPGDLVVTADIPLADRVIDKGGHAIDPRGDLYSTQNIKDRLSMRDIMNELRGSGLVAGGPPPFNKKDRQAFANQLNSFLTKHVRK